jgi:hypothetical protein
MEIRSSQDRRHNHNPFYNIFSLKGKRRTLRRSTDLMRVTTFDQYHPTLLFYVLTVLSLSLLDAALTLVLLQKGAVEINPVMRYYIGLGPWVFVIVKYGITALSLILIVVFNAIIYTRHRIASLLTMPFCVSVFGSVVIWELYLLAN